MSSHLEEQLQRDIDRIRGKIREMFGLVERALSDSLKALLEDNRQLAYLVILRDQRIDELENEIDRLCLEFLVRQQPVAAHLRFVYVTMKLNQELERIGDYSESIARQVLKISGSDLRFLHERFRRISELASEMLRKAVTAFLDQSPDLAAATMETESVVDELRNQIDRELIHFRQEGQIPLEALTPLMTIVRRFERVADQARNICEEVLYMCTGEHARHVGGDVFRVLFLDDGNACLSQMAENIGNSIGEPKFLFSSAGVNPQPLEPLLLKFMSGKGIDLSRASSKSIQQVPNLEHYQIVVLLGKGLRPLPKLPRKTVQFEWDIKNPAAVQGSPAQIQSAFDDAYKQIQTQIRDLILAILDISPETLTQQTK